MKRVITESGECLTAAEFALRYLRDPSLTCVVIANEITFSGAGTARPPTAPRPGVSEGTP